MVKLIKKEYYPISDRIGLRLDIDNNNISLYEPENPTTNKNEIRLFQTRFFKADWIKNLKDDLFFKMIKTSLIDTKNKLMMFTAHVTFDTGEGFPYAGKSVATFDSIDCFKEGCSLSYSEKLMNEFERLIAPFLTIEIRKQNDLLYKNSIDKINEEELNFYLEGVDDFEVLLSVDSLYKNYIDLKDVKVYEDFQSTAVKVDEYSTIALITEHSRYIAPSGDRLVGTPPSISGVVNYLFNVKLFGNLTTYKGKTTKK